MSTLSEMMLAISHKHEMHSNNVFEIRVRIFVRQVLGIARTALHVLICVFLFFGFCFGPFFRASKVRPRTVTQPFATGHQITF